MFTTSSSLMSNLEILIQYFETLDNVLKLGVIIAIISLSYMVVGLILSLATALLNAITIWLRGYPPAHCDVDGTHVTQDPDDNESQDDH